MHVYVMGQAAGQKMSEMRGVYGEKGKQRSLLKRKVRLFRELIWGKRKLSDDLHYIPSHVIIFLTIFGNVCNMMIYQKVAGHAYVFSLGTIPSVQAHIRRRIPFE